MSETYPLRPFSLSPPSGCLSAEAAAGGLADHFRYGFVTGHRPENSPNGSLLISSAAAPDSLLPNVESGSGPSMQTLEYGGRHSLCAGDIFALMAAVQRQRSVGFHD
ncbi:MAG: hypothetical protein KJ725_20445 [Gammaproteobacteria bacterium]|nr:hypothetical protein [Gammaproteobacteria bacterium]